MKVFFSLSTGDWVAAQRLISLMFSTVDFRYHTGGFSIAIFSAAWQALL